MRGTSTVGALGALLLAGCSSSATVATFNIRYFPSESTDRARVADRIEALDASLIAVQEIHDAAAMEVVLAEISARGDREYRLLPGTCGGQGDRITTGVIYDEAAWDLVEHYDYPDLRPDGDCTSMPGTLGMFRNEQGRMLGVLSVHLDPFPRNFERRKRQWGRLLERLEEIERRHDAPVLAMGDYNSTGLRGEPEAERDFIDGTVAAAGHELLTRDLACTEYWRPREDHDGPYRPSILDHMVATGGRWGDAEVREMCQRLDCEPTEPEHMDPDYFSVSDHCPVVVRGKL